MGIDIVSIIVALALAGVLIMLVQWLASVAPLPGPIWNIVIILIVLCAVVFIVYRITPLLSWPAHR